MTQKHLYRNLLLIGLLLLGCNLSTTPTPKAVQAVHKGPFVFLIAPENQIYERGLPRYASGTEIQFYALAQDTEVGVVRLEFTIDGMLYQDVTSAQPQNLLNGHITWTAAEPRKYLITVEAFRADGSLIGRDDRPIEVTASPVKLPSSSSAPIPTPTSNSLDVNTSNNPAPTASLPLISLRINANPNLTVRQGPGTNYPAIGSLNFGDQAAIIGRSSDAQWWAVHYGANTGWVLGSLTVVDGDTSPIPVLTP
ncbi:MAG TPA: SH3 domain-containing protein [Aggregatilineaceae bacterium]|nr:SH3 domain-containing protein [Aggregatilineaceae bacterium]